MENNLWLKTV